MQVKKSEYIVVKKSRIHGTGIFAKKFIPKGIKVIEYIGEKITKEEGDKRVDFQLEKAKSNPKECGAVYIFELDDNYDIDGNVDYNDAKYINHSCNPNCYIKVLKGHILIFALRNIKKGEEIFYNYGYDFDISDYQDHQCKCNSQNCVGYILAKEHWPKLRKLQKKLYGV